MTQHSNSKPVADQHGTAHELAPAPMRFAAYWRWGKLLLQFGLPCLVLWIIFHELRSLDIGNIRTGLAGANARLVAWGVAAAFGAIAVMGLYDAVAFPSGKSGKLSFGKRWSLGAVLFGWTNFVSMGPFGGPALRVLAYRRFGLTGAEITRGLTGHYIGSSAGLIGWLLGAWAPGLGGEAGLVLRATIALAGALAAAIIMGRVIIPILRRHHLGVELDNIPLARLAVVSFAEWGLTLLSFSLLIRAVGVTVDPIGAARTVFTGQFAGVASMIPGGLGSADAVWFKGFRLLGVPHDPAAAAILVFRAGFYFAPWIVAVGVLYTVLAIYSERVRLWQRRVVAGAVMLNAILLLLSAATPAIRERLDDVERIVPLGAIEVSHLLATCSAALMLFLVRGLLRGYRAAYISTLALLFASAVAHPLKGGDFEEAIVSIALLAMLFGVRGAFTRKGRIPIGWELTLAGGVGSLAFFLVAGLAAFERIPYRHDLWTTFTEHADASRYLRAAILLAVVVLVIVIRQALRPAKLWVTPSNDEIERAEAFAREHADSADMLLVGGADKGVWFWEPERGEPLGMVLYQRHGDKLIVFKDPVLAPGAKPEGIINALQLHADDLDVDLVFSMISGVWMNHLHDFGYRFLKVNEEAIVSLVGFTLGGGRNAGFRRTIRDVEKAGVTFEILAPPFDAATVNRLREVSDAWLASKGGHELQFSACCFSEGYLQRNQIGVARDSAGQIFAFVNILTTKPGGSATLDLMRHVPGSVDNVIDFIINRVMEALAAQGYTEFSLGGAPLSDVGVWRSSRLVERGLRLFSQKAERIYNYKGLLHYKSKFHPEWVPRYLAYRQPWEWASSLIASARLVQARSRADRRRIASARIEPAPKMRLGDFPSQA